MLGILLVNLAGLYILGILGIFGWFIYPLGVGGMDQLLVCYFSPCVIIPLVNADVRLAQLVKAQVQSDATLELHTAGCAKLFEVPFTADLGFMYPLMNVVRRAWKIVLYFAAPKLLIGARSAVVVLFTAVLPSMALASGGDDPLLGRLIRYEEHPIAYSVVICSLWLVGAIDLVGVALVSVNWTSSVCSEQKSESKENEFSCGFE
ncbi:hypothetical protein PHYPSEUDO_001039 [Phytophthora pseudosyringae]|uniref:Uncharacterized protein n=1 Tax=Phytophthora pseudosyringae TaxID=221518 RepID=A0A8T1W1E9_9STRA|nr:hypothetical protein PHYPSEUDO_001039 [Phytophthora pseudosyringae]